MSEKFKTMPHSIEAEQSIIGAMIIDKNAIHIHEQVLCKHTS